MMRLHVPGFTRERGQIIMLSAILATIFLGMAGLAVDTGVHFAERRQAQNAADQAAMAAALEKKYGSEDPTAIAAALENAAGNGYNNDGTDNSVIVNIPPTQGNYAGDPGAIEVFIEEYDTPTFFIHVLVPSTATIRTRGVAIMHGGGGEGTDEDGNPAPVVLPNVDCGDGAPVVDGRVLKEAEGYKKIADLRGQGGDTDFGDFFLACDSQFMYFAMRLNGPSTGGAVANENVYGGDDCKDPGNPDVDGTQIKKLKGTVTSVGSSSFTLNHNGTVWTVDVNSNTEYKDIPGFSAIIPGMGFELEGTIVGTNHIVATKVTRKNDTYCMGDGGTTDDYNDVYNTGWSHKFNDLKGSDRARFQIACDGEVRHDFIQDYLRETGNHWASDVSGDGSVYEGAPTSSASSLEWNLEHPHETGWYYGTLQSPPFNPQYPTYESQYDNWVWEMIYEFKVPRGPLEDCDQVHFGLHDFGGSTGGLEGIHSSPPKVDTGRNVLADPFIIRLVE